MWLILAAVLNVALYQCQGMSALVATLKPKLLIIDLSSYTNNWNIIAEPNSTINITVLDVRIGQGYTGYSHVSDVGACHVDYVKIFDSNSSDDPGLKICGDKVKDEWKGWQSTTNNVSIVYHTNTFERFEFYISLEYSKIRHECRQSPCQNGSCIEVSNEAGYVCRCEPGFTGMNCSTHEEFLKATLQTSHLFVGEYTGRTQVWHISSNVKSFIYVYLSLVNKDEHGVKVTDDAVIYIIDTNGNSRNISTRDLLIGVSWVSTSNNITIESIDRNEAGDFRCDYTEKPLEQFCTATRENHLFEGGYNGIKQVWHITANVRSFINVSLSFVNKDDAAHNRTKLSDDSVIYIIDTNGNSRNISTRDLLIGVSWVSTSNNITIESSDRNEAGEFRCDYTAIPAECNLCIHGSCKYTDGDEGYVCTCPGGYIGKRCETIIEFLKATQQTNHKIVYRTGTKHLTKKIWYITTEPNSIINISVSVVKPRGNISSYSNRSTFIKIYDTEHEDDLHEFTLMDILNGILLLSKSNNVTIECDDQHADIDLNIGYNQKPLEQFCTATRENHLFERGYTGIKQVWHISSNVRSFINVSLSFVNKDEAAQNRTKLSDDSVIYIIDTNGNSRNISTRDLLIGVSWVSTSNNITIESSDRNEAGDFRCDYTAIPEECNLCKHGSCKYKDGVEGYVCTCPPGYIGIQCETIIGLHCSAENYTVPFSQYIFQWRSTLVDTVDVLACPFGYIGNATRNCVRSKLTGDGAKWQKPDFTGCISEEIKAIADETFSLAQDTDISSIAVNNLTKRLTSATAAAKRKSLYPGDLATVTNTVQKLAELVQTTHFESADLSSVAQGYGNAVGNIVDLSLIGVWTFTSEEFVQNNLKSILSSVEVLSANVAKKKVDILLRKRRKVSQHTANETVHVKANNLEFHISFHERLAICEDVTNITLGDDRSNSVILSSSVFKAAIENSGDRYIQVYTARFSSIAGVLDASKETEAKAEGCRNCVLRNQFINSEILSSKILNIPEEEFQHLSQPVILLLEIKNRTRPQELREKCVFVNMSSSDINVWSDKGCMVDYHMSNASHIACKCNHLTNFAVLMDVFEVQANIDYIDYTILTYISYIGGVMSALACIITVIVFQFFSLKKERVLVHQQLAVSIVLVQVFFLIGIDRTENKYVCIVMAALLHFSVISMFCWMLVEGFHLYVMLVKVFRRKTNFRKYLLFGWGVPLVVVGISVGVFNDQYGGHDRCWLSHDIVLMAFVPVVGLVIVINTVILIVVLRIMMKSMLSRANSEERSAIKAGLKAAAILLPLLGITWTLGFFSVNNRETLIFTYLFTFFNSLQGVFFFVFHCLLNTDVKNAFERRSQRRSMTKLLTESLGQDSRTRKSSTINTVLTSKSSINSILNEPSSGKKKSKLSNNDMDRIHRDNMADIYDKHYHHNLQRSFSDGIPRWQNINKDIQFYTGKDNVNMLNGYRSLNGEKYHENGHLFVNKISESGEKHPKDFRIEDLYRKPIKRKESSDPKNELIQKDNRVKFEELETQRATVENLKDALVKELKERASSFQT